MADMIPITGGMEAIDEDKQELSANFEVLDQLGAIIQADVQKLKDCAHYMSDVSADKDGIIRTNALLHPGTLKTYLECVNLITKTTKELLQIKKQAKGKGSGIEWLLEDLGIE